MVFAVHWHESAMGTHVFSWASIVLAHTTRNYILIGNFGAQGQNKRKFRNENSFNGTINYILTQRVRNICRMFNSTRRNIAQSILLFIHSVTPNLFQVCTLLWKGKTWHTTMVRNFAWRAWICVSSCNHSNTTEGFLVYTFGTTNLDHRNGTAFRNLDVFSVTSSQEFICVKLWLISRACAHSVVSKSLQPWTHQSPLSMDFPDKNTWVGCHFLLQGIFLTQGSN